MTDFPIYDQPPFLRLPQVTRRYRCARSTIYAWMATNGFPRPVKLGARLVAWRLADLQAWEDERGLAPPGAHLGRAPQPTA